jgi:hypothetical protein
MYRDTLYRKNRDQNKGINTQVITGLHTDIIAAFERVHTPTVNVQKMVKTKD